MISANFFTIHIIKPKFYIGIMINEKRKINLIRSRIRITIIKN